MEIIEYTESPSLLTSKQFILIKVVLETWRVQLQATIWNKKKQKLVTGSTSTNVIRELITTDQSQV